jgi:hypothetical protein
MSNCAILGTSKIASIHLNSLLKNNFKKFFLVSRNINKAKKFISEYKLQKNKNIYPSDYAILNKENFDLINICVNTNHHSDCLDLLRKSKSLIIVEKPIIPINIFKGEYSKYLKRIYKKHNNLLVCYPMLFLAKSFLKKFSVEKNINKLEIFYNTNGKNKFNDIGQDLLPHAISLAYELLGKKKFSNKILKIKSKVYSKKWCGVIILKNTELKFNFTENLKKKSQFYFKINNKTVKRTTKIINGVFTNFLKFKNNKIKIKNPMHEFLNYSLKNKNNFSWLHENKTLTYEVMKINSLFLNK